MKPTPKAEEQHTHRIKCPECVCYFEGADGLAAHANVWHYKPPGKAAVRRAHAEKQVFRRFAY
ncbi:hypothetical protein BX661DRAFT_175896 [Kickxella alabastrina]|uniref:uncharacterized protein n=1 Tax=Kickxella alabastrina TaxID=61397 RepID=UPI00221E7341|nr:uncharacterized protein BX661DRAFT_175896 [Kickxella alabastrina]KAI7834988.1 hypothetical protein BX661DRAFT_175896 [Kickxella alabastrina]